MKTMTLDELKNLPPLSEKELEIIRNAKPTPDKDCPAQTKEQLKQFKPWYEVHAKENYSDVYKMSVKKAENKVEIAKSLFGILPADVTLEEARTERLASI